MSNSPKKPEEKPAAKPPVRRTTAATQRPSRKEEEEARRRSARKRDLTARVIVWIGLSIACGLFISPPRLVELRSYEVGDIADETLKAPRDLSVIDRESTRQRREAARLTVPPVYDYDEQTAPLLSNQIQAYFREVRKAWSPVWELENQIGEARQAGRTAQVKQLRDKLPEARAQAQEAAPDPQGIFNKEISAETIEAFRKVRFNEELANALQRALEQILRPGVIGSLRDFPTEPGAEITIRRVPSKTETIETDLSRFSDLESARKKVAGVVQEWVADVTTNKQVLDASARLIRNLLRPNIARNIQETEARRERAAEEVKPAYVNLKAGEAFVREGERIDPQDLDILEALNAEQEQGTRWVAFLFTSVAMALGLLVVYFFATRHLRFFRSGTKDLQFYALLLAMVLAGVRLVPDPWEWGGYVAFAAILIRLLLPAEIAFLFATVASVLAEVTVETRGLYGVYSLTSAMVCVQLVAHSTNRLALLRSGAALGVFNVIGYWAALYISEGIIVPDDLRTSGLLFGLGIVGVFAFVYPLSWLAERLFNYTSALSLMELNDTNHPLVKDLFFKTPGTYQHSLVIGTLCEGAAKAIGADALLLRVGALYHDIGKTKMPQYFIENMPDGGKNSPHNKLSPNMSAIIIASHVKDGIEMAREARLPQRVIDLIPAHHGTKLMKYFWGKAQEQHTPEMPPLREEDFRYPGPKPQNREGAIMLLADSTEAAVRTLPEFTEARIRGAVQKIVNDAFADGQLSESDLTLRDLNEIAKAFTKTLTAFHHHRIRYPEPAEKTRKKAAVDGDTGAKTAARPQGAEQPAEETREESLKRLGSS